MDTCTTMSVSTKHVVYLCTCYLCFYMMTVHVARGGRSTRFANISQDASAVPREREARDESVGAGG